MRAIAAVLLLSASLAAQLPPSKFWTSGHQWTIREVSPQSVITTDGIDFSFQDDVWGFTDCKTRTVYVLRSLAPAAKRLVLRHEFGHIANACTVIDADDDADVVIDRQAEMQENLVQDRRNRPLIRYLHRRM